MHLVSNSARLGFWNAWMLFRFYASREWIAHVKSDRYLSRDQFIEFYSRLLPGATFARIGNFMGLVWTAPDPAAVTRAARSGSSIGN